MRSVCLAFFRQHPSRAVKSLLVFLLFLAGGVYATNYSLWINGRNNPNVQAGNHADFTYWGPASTAAGVNKKSVNWDGFSRVSDQNYRVRDALDCYCTGSNWCYIAAHSAGNLQIGYALSLYGGTARSKKTLRPMPRGCVATAMAQPKPDGTSNGWMWRPELVAAVSWQM